MGQRTTTLIDLQDNTVAISFPRFRASINGSLQGDGSIEGRWQDPQAAADIKLHRAQDVPPLPVPPPREEIQLPESELERFQGTYAMTANNMVAVRMVNGKLVGQLAEADPFILYPASPKIFFSKVMDVEFEFKEDNSGEIAQLVVRKNFRNPPIVSYFRRVR
jgi:hypothetical protein